MAQSKGDDLEEQLIELKKKLHAQKVENWQLKNTNADLYQQLRDAHDPRSASLASDAVLSTSLSSSSSSSRLLKSTQSARHSSSTATISSSSSKSTISVSKLSLTSSFTLPPRENQLSSGSVARESSTPALLSSSSSSRSTQSNLLPSKSNSARNSTRANDSDQREIDAEEQFEQQAQRTLSSISDPAGLRRLLDERDEQISQLETELEHVKNMLNAEATIRRLLESSSKNEAGVSNDAENNNSIDETEAGLAAVGESDDHFSSSSTFVIQRRGGSLADKRSFLRRFRSNSAIVPTVKKIEMQPSNQWSSSSFEYDSSSSPNAPVASSPGLDDSAVHLEMSETEKTNSPSVPSRSIFLNSVELLTSKLREVSLEKQAHEEELCQLREQLEESQDALEKERLLVLEVTEKYQGVVRQERDMRELLEEELDFHKRKLESCREEGLQIARTTSQRDKLLAEMRVRVLESVQARLEDEEKARLQLLESKAVLVQELEDLTQSLFEESNRMVSDEARRRFEMQKKKEQLEDDLKLARMKLGYMHFDRSTRAEGSKKISNNGNGANHMSSVIKGSNRHVSVKSQSTAVSLSSSSNATAVKSSPSLASAVATPPRSRTKKGFVESSSTGSTRNAGEVEEEGFVLVSSDDTTPVHYATTTALPRMAEMNSLTPASVSSSTVPSSNSAPASASQAKPATRQRSNSQSRRKKRSVSSAKSAADDIAVEESSVSVSNHVSLEGKVEGKGAKSGGMQMQRSSSIRVPASLLEPLPGVKIKRETNVSSNSTTSPASSSPSSTSSAKKTTTITQVNHSTKRKKGKRKKSSASSSSSGSSHVHRADDASLAVSMLGDTKPSSAQATSSPSSSSSSSATPSVPLIRLSSSQGNISRPRDDHDIVPSSAAKFLENDDTSVSMIDIKNVDAAVSRRFSDSSQAPQKTLHDQLTQESRKRPSGSDSSSSVDVDSVDRETSHKEDAEESTAESLEEEEARADDVFDVQVRLVLHSMCESRAYEQFCRLLSRLTVAVANSASFDSIDLCREIEREEVELTLFPEAVRKHLSKSKCQALREAVRRNTMNVLSYSSMRRLQSKITSGYMLLPSSENPDLALEAMVSPRDAVPMQPCWMCGKRRRCRWQMQLNDNDSWSLIDDHCRERVLAVLQWFTFLRSVYAAGKNAATPTPRLFREFLTARSRVIVSRLIYS